MNRVLLLNLTQMLSRSEINIVDRQVGDTYFAGLDLQYGSHFIAEGTGKFAASWLVPDDRVVEVMNHLQSHATPDGYQARMDIRLNSKTSQESAYFS